MHSRRLPFLSTLNPALSRALRPLSLSLRTTWRGVRAPVARLRRLCSAFPGGLASVAVKRFRFVGATLPRNRAPEAHFGADYYTLNLERISVACSSGFPLPASSGFLPARPTHALRTYHVCLLFDFYPLNLERIAVTCNPGFPLPARLWIIGR